MAIWKIRCWLCKENGEIIVIDNKEVIIQA